MDDIDAYRAAKLLLDSKGDTAAAFARERIANLTSEGDAPGRAAWLRIAAAIVLLQPTAPEPEQPIQ